MDAADTQTCGPRYLSAKQTVDDRALNRGVLDRLRQEVARRGRPPRCGWWRSAPASAPWRRACATGGCCGGRTTVWSTSTPICWPPAGSWLRTWGEGAGCHRSPPTATRWSMQGRGPGPARVVPDRRAGRRCCSSRPATPCRSADRQRLPGSGRGAGGAARPVRSGGPRGPVPVHHQLRRRDHLPARAPRRRDVDARLSPQHGRTRPLRAPGRREQGRPPPVRPPARGRRQHPGRGRFRLGGPSRSATAAATPPTRRFFLHTILDTIAEALAERPEIRPATLADWIALRRQQVERAELVFLAHQLDFCGRRPFKKPAQR